MIGAREAEDVPVERHTGTRPRSRNATAYDAIAGAYSAENDSSLLNEYYNRPAIRSLLGDVAGPT